MASFRKNQQTALVIFDIVLLLSAPVVFDPAVAGLIFFLFPLPAILLALVFRILPGNVTGAIEKGFMVTGVIARVFLAAVIISDLFGVTMPLVGVTEVAFLILFLRTYNNYFFAKYGSGFSGYKLAKYILELYLFMLFYIAAVIAIMYVRTLLA